jgi:hypothetical protein
MEILRTPQLQRIAPRLAYKFQLIPKGPSLGIETSDTTCDDMKSMIVGTRYSEPMRIIVMPNRRSGDDDLFAYVNGAGFIVISLLSFAVFVFQKHWDKGLSTVQKTRYMISVKRYRIPTFCEAMDSF